MAQGTVKWFNTRKGFGFITNGEEGPDIFVHYSQIQGAGEKKLREGDVVEYDIVPGEIGPRAAKVIKKNPQEPSQ